MEIQVRRIHCTASVRLLSATKHYKQHLNIQPHSIKANNAKIILMTKVYNVYTSHNQTEINAQKTELFINHQTVKQLQAVR